MTLGDRLLELRKKRNLSQEETAEKLNVTRQTISKWETNQSTPDFDKVIPLCELYEITAEELLTGKRADKIPTKGVINSNEKKENDYYRRRKAIVLTVSIFLYFISIIWIIVAEELNLSEGIVVGIFLLICAIATCMIIYHFTTTPNKVVKKEEISPQIKTRNHIIEITATVFCCIYFMISFLTMAWHVTWIIWIIYAVVAEIIKLIFEILGGKNESK